MSTFKSLPSIRTVLTIEQLTYGIGVEDRNIYIYLRKRNKQWKRRYGPYNLLVQAESVIEQIKEEYNAVRNAEKRRAHTQI